ncbi:Pseudaminic acid synthase [compost metagenome]
MLKCTSSYPAPIGEANLRTIPNMQQTFNSVVGLSDHTMGSNVSIASIALGAKIIEKHFTLRRADGGADSKFSMEPEEFKVMVDGIREVEKALGDVTYDLTYKQLKSREHSRSLFITKDVKKGEIFTKDNVRSIRPGYGLETKYIKDILGKKARIDVKMGTPVKWDIVE